MHISAVVLVKNSESTLQKTLESLKEFDNVVVYDNYSTDKSLQIAMSFNNVNLVQGEFNGFGWTKNNAASFAKYDWIVTIDSDEVVDPLLSHTLLTKELQSDTVYQLTSNTFYKSKQVKHCGWSNQKVKRVYNRTLTRYNSNNVHEEIMADGMKIEVLEGHIDHYSYYSLTQFMMKADYYSTLFAQDNAGKKYSSPKKAFFNALFSFFKTYFLKGGFLDGYIGLVIALSHMVTNFFKYMKLYELNSKLKISEKI